MPNVLTAPAHRALSAAFVVFLVAAVASASLLWRLEQYRLQETRAIVADTAYDADVVDACLRLFREKHYQLPAWGPIFRGGQSRRVG